MVYISTVQVDNLCDKQRLTESIVLARMYIWNYFDFNSGVWKNISGNVPSSVLQSLFNYVAYSNMQQRSADCNWFVLKASSILISWTCQRQSPWAWNQTIALLFFRAKIDRHIWCPFTKQYGAPGVWRLHCTRTVLVYCTYICVTVAGRHFLLVEM